MKKTKVVISLVLCFILLFSLMAGCQTGGKDEQVTLRFSWWGNDVRHEAMLKVIELFEAKYTNIKIEAEYGAQAGYNDNKMVEFASRNAPDIFQIETGAAKNYMNYGVLYNLSDAAKEGWISFDKFPAAFMEANGQFDTGSQWSIPNSVAGSAMVVNKELAAKIGIDFSAQYTWDDLLTWGKKVQEYNAANGTNYYLLGPSLTLIPPAFVRAWARQLNGKPIIDDTAKTLNMTEAQFEECFTLINELFTSKTLAPLSIKTAYNNHDWDDPNWIDGNYVAMVSYTSQADSLANAANGFTCVAGKMPVMSGAKSDGWFANTGRYMGISAYTAHPKEAAMFLDFFFNDPAAAEALGAAAHGIPPMDYAQQMIAEKDLASAILVDSTAIAGTYNGRDDSGLTTHDESLKIMEDLIGEIAYGRMTPAQAAKAAVDRLNAFLATV